MPTRLLITRWIIWIGAIMFVLVMVLAAAIADESERKYLEDKANASLSVYALRIGKLDLQPLTPPLHREKVAFIQKR